MANKRREHNREESQRHHKEDGFSGSKGKATQSSGSYAHRGERVGPGEQPGAGELPAKGPGGSMETKAVMPKDMYPSEKTPAAQKNVPNRTRGQEEDE